MNLEKKKKAKFMDFLTKILIPPLATDSLCDRFFWSRMLGFSIDAVSQIKSNEKDQVYRCGLEFGGWGWG